MGYLSISLDHVQLPFLMFYKCFTSLVMFIPGYFKFSDVIFICFYILFIIFHYEYKKITWFSVSILYPSALLNSFASSIFLWSLYSFIYILSSAYSDSFTSPLQMWITLISFSYLMAVARTSSTMLHRLGESGHPCLPPNFNRKAFSCSPLSIILAVCFVINGLPWWLRW